MARTTIKPRPPGYKPVQLARKAKSHNVSFKDHRGNPALMSWRNSVGDSSLPPLASWVFYMVNPDVSPDFNGCMFRSGFELDQKRGFGSRFRYEFFFLPGATAQECAAHFKGEREARDTIWRQIEKVWVASKNAIDGEQIDDSIEGPTLDDKAQEDAIMAGKLPGLVWSREDEDIMGYIGYHSWLFMYSHADIHWEKGTDDLRQVSLVRFDPIDQKKKKSGYFDPMEHPVRVDEKSAKGDRYEGDGLIMWMEDRSHSKWQAAADEATHDAIKLGWESW